MLGGSSWLYYPSSLALVSIGSDSLLNASMVRSSWLNKGGSIAMVRSEEACTLHDTRDCVHYNDARYYCYRRRISTIRVQYKSHDID